MKFLVLITSVLLLSTKLYSQKTCTIAQGNWIGNLQINENTQLPFNFLISHKNDKTIFTILNGQEEIELIEGECIDDTFHFSFPVFNSELTFKVNSNEQIEGYWNNKMKTNYTMPFTGKLSFSERFPVTTTQPCLNFNGHWETEFSNEGENPYPALGIFKQKGTQVTGTFLTETGDYRFLEGNVYGNQLYLSCFDGSHAFMFTAQQNNEGILTGKFYSGKHWQNQWTAKRNDNFKLPSPDSITYLAAKTSALNFNYLTFTLPNIDGSTFSFPNQNTTGKVVIIQLLGTWCPNCFDETRYYKELYEKYHGDGLEIISIGYEASHDTEAQINALKSYKKRMKLDYTFLLGGQANKALASEQFKILNEIVSFPTSIFIDRKGNIQRVHTGFNGPGTGKYYEEYIKSTDDLIKRMLTN